MALQVWLPLTKDLRQQGVNSLTASNSGATYSSTGGKLGGCYVFDGTDDSIGVGNLSTIVDTNFSFTCWFYHDDTWSSKSYETIFGGPSGFELEGKVSSTNSPTIKAYSWGGGTFTYELNKWNHLVMTRTSSETKFYLNGELKLTGGAGTIPSGNYFVGSWSTTSSQNYKGKICDVRIYDTCLSAAEVKRISQGLILHYPLDRNGWGNENILTNTNDLTQWSKESGITVTWDEDEQMYKMIDTSHTSSRWGMYQNFTVTPNTTYTFSVEGKAGDNTTAMGVQTWESTASWSANRYTFTSTKSKGVYTFTTGANDTVGRIYLNITTASSGNKTAWFKSPKLELGSKTTSWCPNSADSIYATLGLNGTTEYDMSGFGNNGTYHGTFTYSSDTSKYAVSTTATGSATTYLEGPVLPSEAKTVALWIKNTSKATNGAIFNDKTTGLQIGLLNSLLYMNSLASTAGFTTTHWVNGAWNHVVAVNNNGTRSLYVNGQAETQSGASNYYIHNVNNCWIWNRSYNNNYPFTGSLSDLRVYTTALSTDDVKSLYQNCATIDSDGTIHGQIR